MKVLGSSISYSASPSSISLPLVECETISEGTQEIIVTFITS